MPNISVRPLGPLTPNAPVRSGPAPAGPSGQPALRIVSWPDPIADPHGVPPCSRYVELYWLPVIGPSTME